MGTLSSWPFCLLLFFLHPHIGSGDHGTELPRFTWIDNYNIRVLFPNGIEPIITLWTAENVGDMEVSCLFEGVLEIESSSSVAVSGCQDDDIVHIVIYSSLLPRQMMFNIRNGVTEEVEKINADDVEESNVGRLGKRSISLEDDYDEVSFDADLPDPSPFLSLDVKLAFEETLLSKLGTEDAAREYIARVFTFGKQHFRHASLGVSIRLRAQGPIRKISNKSWKPSIPDLKDTMKSKDQNNVAPETYFCNNKDGSKIMGISYRRKGCHEKKGVAIVNYQEDINKASQTYIHECGHWFGFNEDAEYDSDRGTECEGKGIMSSLNTPGGRPSKWSICSKNRLRKWLNRPENNCLKEDTKQLQKNSFLDAKYETVIHINPKCATVTVSGADYADCNGEYMVSNDRTHWLPSRPVYKHVSLDRYIFWNARGHGWSIGKKDYLETGGYYHYSGLDSQEPWEAQWRNGIAVECGGVKDEVALIVGGYGGSRRKVELWSPSGKCNRRLKDLPSGDHQMTTNYINVNGGLILSCGGNTWRNKCYSLNIETEEWMFHSTMLKSRSSHSSVVINDTTLYIISGYPTDSGSTTEYLEPGTSVWKEGPAGNVKAGAKRYGSCSVQTSPDTFVVHGGYDCSGGKCENEYNFITKKWTRFGNAAEAWRDYHGCAVVQTEDIFGFLIAGGGTGNSASTTSFFLDLKANSPEWRKSSNMNFPHVDGRILKLDGRYFILGGETSTKVEEYHPENGTWTAGLPDVLYTREYMYGTTAVPSNMFSNCN